MRVHHHLAGVEPATAALIIGTVILLGLGQVLFKLAAKDIHFSQPSSLLSIWLLFAIAVYAVATLAWLFILSRVPLSSAFPFYGLIFLFVPVLARYLLHEPLRPQVLVGGIIILAGVIVSSLGTIK